MRVLTFTMFFISVLSLVSCKASEGLNLELPAVNTVGGVTGVSSPRLTCTSATQCPTPDFRVVTRDGVDHTRTLTASQGRPLSDNTFSVESEYEDAQFIVFMLPGSLPPGLRFENAISSPYTYSASIRLNWTPPDQSQGNLPFWVRYVDKCKVVNANNPDICFEFSVAKQGQYDTLVNFRYSIGSDMNTSFDDLKGAENWGATSDTIKDVLGITSDALTKFQENRNNSAGGGGFLGGLFGR